MADKAEGGETKRWLVGETGVVEGEIIRETPDFLMVRLSTCWDAGHWVFQPGDVLVLDKQRLQKVDGYWEIKEKDHVAGDLV